MKVRIRELLKERGMTTAQLAEKSGSDQRSINSLVTRASFTVGSLSRYAAPINVPTWELVHDCGTTALGHEPADGTWIKNPIRELRIEALMQEQHVSRAELSRRMGVSNASITMMMKRGSDKLSAVVIEKLMNALNVPVWQLFVSEDEYYAEVARRRGCTPDDVRRQIQVERDKALDAVVTDRGAATAPTPSSIDKCTSPTSTQEKPFPEDLFAAAATMGAGAVQEMVMTLSDGRRLKIKIEVEEIE